MVSRQAPIFLQNRAPVGKKPASAAQISPRIGGLRGLVGRKKALTLKMKKIGLHLDTRAVFLPLPHFLGKR
jgi:hypothetical protein